MYIASYMMKGLRGMTTLLQSVSNEASDSIKKIRKVGSAFMNAEEISIHEAVCHILGLGTRNFSRKVVFVQAQQARTRMLKSEDVLSSMEDTDINIYQPRVIEHHEALNDNDYRHKLTLARFACGYDMQQRNQTWEDSVDDETPAGFGSEHSPTEKSDGFEVIPSLLTTTTKRKFLRRNQAAILRYFKLPKQQDFEKHCEQLLMLYKSWRCIDDLLGQHATYADAWAMQLQDPMTQRDYNLFKQREMADVDWVALEAEVNADQERLQPVTATQQVNK